MRIGKPQKVTEEPKPHSIPVTPEKVPTREPVPVRRVEPTREPVKVGAMPWESHMHSFEFDAECPDCGRVLIEDETDEGLVLKCPTHGGLVLTEIAGLLE